MEENKIDPSVPAQPVAAAQTLANPAPDSKPDDVQEESKPASEPAKEAHSIAADTEASTVAKESAAQGRMLSQSCGFDPEKPLDFEGEVNTNNEIPSAEVLRKVEKYVVLDRHGKSHTFRSLYTGHNVARRVLVLFVRHFFCGNCQEYLRSLAESITPEALLRLPVSTFIVVVGCGDPSLIDMYVSETNCPFPVYTDPKRSLFDALGMTKTLAMGSKPAYMKKPMLRSAIDSVIQGLKQIPTGKALKSGDQRQVGGEFLFEPLDLATPMTTPQDELTRPMGAFEDRQNGAEQDETPGEEEKRITWCHRMKTTRDHAEIPELMEVLGLAGNGQPIKDRELWSKAVEQRKGTGLSMASEMSKLSAEHNRAPAS